MRRVSDRSHVSGSARAQEQAHGPRRNHTAEDEDRPSPTRVMFPERERDASDGLSDGRFPTTSIMYPNSSLESYSYDSEERPRSRTSLRDRRKRFDTTTPTLIDEEEVLLDDAEHEILSLDHIGQHGYVERVKDDSSLRRTPGASMYRSQIESSTSQLSSSVDVASMRRTPGASAMHRSVEPLSIESAPKEEVAGLGFGLTLSTPIGGEDQTHATRKPGLWKTFPSHSRSPSPSHSFMPSEAQPHKPPLPPSTLPPATCYAARPRRPEVRGPFSSPPWSTATAQPKVHSTDPSADGRTGAFSPNMLRLTEDIGNILQDDEDDDYTLEVPSVFRGDTEDMSQYTGDWTGSYVFDATAGGRPSKPSVPRPSATPKDWGRARRRPPGSASGHVTFLPNAQQPKPRRSVNEGFDFGKQRVVGEEHQSPQLVHFGGAFVPPASTLGSASSYGRPAAPPMNDAPRFEYSVGSSSASTPRDHGSFQVGTTSGGGLRVHSLDTNPGHSMSFYDQVHTYRQMGNYVPSSNVGMVGSPVFPGQHSEMQATAREFVPMATRSNTPQYPRNRWSGEQPTLRLYDPSIDQGNWHANKNYGYTQPTYAYGMPPQSSRSAVTPSPHRPSWRPTEAMVYSAPHPPAPSSVEGMHPTYKAPPSTPTPSASTSRSELSYRDNASAKSKRSKKGKKKPGRSDFFSRRKPAGSAKKKGRGEVARPGSTTQDGNDTMPSSSEMESKRADLIESPSTRVAFKDFYRSFRCEERVSFQKAEEFALGALDDGSLPDSVHWRVYLELADLAKRSNRYVEARRLYQKVCQLQPYASQGWLDYSKLEEECGHMNRVMNIVHAGLEYCEHSESLLTRAVRHQEKMGNLANARGLLARLKHVGIERVWRTVLEGALLEGRAGNFSTARRVLKYLMHHVPWYGPLYLEAYRLERDQGNPSDALHIVERGLQAIPRYGPLWFGSFRLCEEMDLSQKQYHLPKTMDMIERAKASISKELVWKVHLEAAQMLERAALLQAPNGGAVADDLLCPARHRLALTVLTCPNNLRWKVWLASARMELGVGNVERARALFLRAHKVVPDKGRSATLLECARLEEFTGDSDLAQSVLCKARVDYGHDWKVWLEGVLLEMRTGRFLRAYEICTCALEMHQGTGRLWASLVQLSYFSGRDAVQYFALRRALNVVPKSGEVWCEGGRIHLNPFSDTFDPERARRHLYFATKFTPQYGDSFIETLRWEVLNQWLLPIADFIWEKTSSCFLTAKGGGARTEERLIKYIADVSLAVSIARQSDSGEDPTLHPPGTEYQSIIPTLRERLRLGSVSESIDLSDLRLTCSNADPNYGSLWFHCRRGANDTPRRVIEDAACDIAAEIHKYSLVYLAAAVRRMAVLSGDDGLSARPSSVDSGTIETTDPAVVQWEDRNDERLRSAPSLEEIFNPVDPTTGQGLVESTTTGRLFVTGLSEMNKHQPIESMPLGRRRRALFGNDALFP